VSDAQRAEDFVLWNGTLDGWSAYAAQDSAANLATESGAAPPALRLLFTLADATSWGIARRDDVPVEVGLFYQLPGGLL
jgi:hypothetical protein